MLSLLESSRCFCFAGDTKLSCATSDIFTDCQIDLNKLVDWSSEKFSIFNAEKYVYIHISESHKRDFKRDHVSLQKVHYKTYLGVEPCSELKWSRHMCDKQKLREVSFVSDTMSHIAY